MGRTGQCSLFPISCWQSVAEPGILLVIRLITLMIIIKDFYCQMDIKCLKVVPDSVQQAEALSSPVQEGDGPDEGQSRGPRREVLGLPHPFEQELKVRENYTGRPFTLFSTSRLHQN